MYDRVISGLRDTVAGVTARAKAAANQTVIRVAVTGLSRAGKTVFLTSLITNLIALGRGVNTLPGLQRLLTGTEDGRLRHVRVVPAAAETTSYFDYSSKLAELAADDPAWPPATIQPAQIALDIEIDRTNAIWSKFGPRSVRLELLDYPGEWLLDLPLLSRSYAQWSHETLTSLRSPPRDAVCAPFLEFLTSVAPQDKADHHLLRRCHERYVDALRACRDRLGLRYLQPGRLLCPGPQGDAPYLWLFPLDRAPERPAAGTAGALLRDRFEAYKAKIRADFFDTSFTAFSRQIVLVDVLGALHAGRAAFDDTRRVIADIANCMSYRSESASGLVYEAGAAALRAGRSLIGAGSRRQIDRVAFVATKADHVPALRRQNLQGLLRDLVERAGRERTLGGQPVSFHTVAAVLSTRDDIGNVDGRPVEVVRGRVLGEDRDRGFFPGDVPSGWPPESFWSKPFFDLPRFKPPRIDPTGQFGIPHLGLDEVMASLLSDVL
jgi:uncharacterized protein